MQPQETPQHIQNCIYSLSDALIKVKIEIIKIEFRVKMMRLNNEAGFKQLSYAFTAWAKLIAGTQDDFTPIGMSDRDLFFYMLTGNEYDL
jgi:hypothetical protein